AALMAWMPSLRRPRRRRRFPSPPGYPTRKATSAYLPTWPDALPSACRWGPTRMACRSACKSWHPPGRTCACLRWHRHMRLPPTGDLHLRRPMARNPRPQALNEAHAERRGKSALAGWALAARLFQRQAQFRLALRGPGRKRSERMGIGGWRAAVDFSNTDRLARGSGRAVAKSIAL